MAYQSKHTGANIDAGIDINTTQNSRLTALESKDIELQNNINQVSNNLSTLSNNTNSSISNLNTKDTDLQNQINALKTTNSYYCNVFYSGSGDTSFSGNVKFNQIKYNQGNCYSASTGAYTVPEDGFYLATFTYYSNSATHQRPAIMCTGYDNAMTNATSAAMGHCVTTIRYLTKGATITAGAYSSSFPINLYAAAGHNEFCVIKIK